MAHFSTCHLKITVVCFHPSSPQQPLCQGWYKHVKAFGIYDYLFLPLMGSAQNNSAGSSGGAMEKRKLTPREKRFIMFASVEHDGQIYMTPQDFLESVVDGEPKSRFKRKKWVVKHNPFNILKSNSCNTRSFLYVKSWRLSKAEVDTMLNRMPKLSKNDEGFFRGLGNKGLISFSEYLFLLTILIKPQVCTLVLIIIWVTPAHLLTYSE